jgi:hypothetical protein
MMLRNVHDRLRGSGTLYGTVRKGEDGVPGFEVPDCRKSLLDVVWMIVGTDVWSLESICQTFDLKQIFNG